MSQAIYLQRKRHNFLHKMSAQTSRFKNWDFSLLDVENEQIQQLTRSQVGQWTSDKNFDSAILLLTEDFKAAEQRIKQVLLRDPENIQAWNNKGYLLSSKGEDAEEALNQRDKFLADNPIKGIEAKVEYGAWLYLFIRTPKAKMNGLSLLQECFEGRIEDPQQHFLYLKVLSSEVRATTGKNEIILRHWIEQLKWFLKREKEETVVWAEITGALDYCSRKNAPETNRALQNMAPLLKVKGDLNLDVCAKKLHDLVTRGEVVQESGNMYARLAKSLAYIEHSNVLVDIDVNVEKLKKALDIGEMYSIVGDAKFATGPMVCAVILLDLWAVNYYNHHAAEVREKFRAFYRGSE